MPGERTDLGSLLARATRRLIELEQPILKRHDLSMWQYAVLTRLARSPVSTQRALAQEIGHDPTRLVALVTGLEADGLVARSVDPSDGRARVIEITDRGRERHAAVQVEIHAMEDDLLREVPQRDREAVGSVLRRLAP